SRPRAAAGPKAAPGGLVPDRHQVAIARVCAGARWDRKLVAELFLVDRREPPAAARRRAENAEHALPGAVDELDDAPGVADRIVLFAALRDPQQGAVADAGDLVRPRAARNAHADLGCGAVLGLVPLGGQRDQLAVGIARGDVGDHDWGQGPGVMQLLAAALDAAFVGKLAQHALERGAVGVLQAEGAGDLAGADLAGLLPDEGEEVVFGGEGREGWVWGRVTKIKSASKTRLWVEIWVRATAFASQAFCRRSAIECAGWAKSFAER